ncbi:hypothetical protein [Paenibacillus elgii]|uniref:hypothetical protein n=1 Tax=Paenibacillus elgii TaxID=189691 RepID=UPI0013D2082D|nr:hypothetical protein [Paenibacillus elgii]
MALVHEFLLIDESEYRKHDPIDLYKYTKVNIENVIILDDDFFGYIADSLKWIPTYDPFRHEDMMGFNYWGISVLHKESMNKFIPIITSWRDLFQVGPETINLRGEFSWTADDIESGQYKQLHYERDALIKNLEQFIWFGQRVKEQNYVIVYFGI